MNETDYRVFHTGSPTADGPAIGIIDPRERKHDQRDRCPVEQLPCFKLLEYRRFPFSQCDGLPTRPSCAARSGRLRVCLSR
ncbi:protein of unknown function (plasmid) [Paraburkholderia dioscoreae]|uniref:Uncharacterized protein n=1 Tax=Paraburkholderia dioscoreae TaxID=2604047 RepID=A0A5Q4ZEQ6_9BURK|nr:protein of unknown function [Paraburkholderia dioscoreae]